MCAHMPTNTTPIPKPATPLTTAPMNVAKRKSPTTAVSMCSHLTKKTSSAWMANPLPIHNGNFLGRVLENLRNVSTFPQNFSPSQFSRLCLLYALRDQLDEASTGPGRIGPGH